MSNPAMRTEPAFAPQSAQQVETSLCEQVSAVAGTSSAWLLLHTDFAVMFGRVEASGVAFPPAFAPSELLDPQTLTEFRLFGELGEWHVWRTAPQQFRGRLLVDGGKPTESVIEECHLLWGTRSTTDFSSGWTTLTEDRGYEIAVPHSVTIKGDKDRVRLVVRHYLGRGKEDHLATITDARLVKLTDGNGKALIFAK